jgi:hypothetical protein
MVELSPALRSKFASLDMLLVEFKNRLSDALRTTLDAAVPDDAKTESEGTANGFRRTNYRHPAVVKVSVVQCVPFFGYHNEYRPFIRISLCNPALMNRAAAVLLSGGVMGVTLQPCEAHIPYLLQVWIGCKHIGKMRWWPLVVVAGPVWRGLQRVWHGLPAGLPSLRRKSWLVLRFVLGLFCHSECLVSQARHPLPACDPGMASLSEGTTQYTSQREQDYNLFSGSHPVFRCHIPRTSVIALLNDPCVVLCQLETICIQLRMQRANLRSPEHQRVSWKWTCGVMTY